MVKLKEEMINNADGPTKAVLVKLFDVDEASPPPFRNDRGKIILSDVSGNDIEIAPFQAADALFGLVPPSN